MAQQSRFQSISANGGQVLDLVKRLVHEGNVRRVVIKQGERTVAEFPLTVGVVGAALAPVLAAVGAIAALLSECTIEVERIPEPPASQAEEQPAAEPPQLQGRETGEPSAMG